jgi:type VI secretion system secreted protein VgrG
MASPKQGTAGTAVAPADPTDPEEADKADPGEMDDVKARQREQKQGKYGAAPVQPYKPGQTDPGEEKKTSWIEFEMLDEEGNPVPGVKCKVTLPDGKVDECTLDDKGRLRYDGIDPGSCKITFPELDKDSWEAA